MSAQQQALVAADRVVNLQGGQNFREVGGYPTRDGRRVRRGLLFRSARLDELTGADIEVFHSLGIAVIADLRTSRERSLNPTSEAIRARVRTLAWDTHRRRNDDIELADLFRLGADSSHYFQSILGLYRTIAIDHAHHFRELFEAVADGALPVLIHCAAGKDRTGIAVGLLLEILGVERAFVLADYAKTEQLLDWDRLTAAAMLGAGLSLSWLERLDPSARSLLFRSDERYLQAVFEDMEAQQGSVTAFVIERLQVKVAVIDRLRERLIED
jgi:protein-tyrosine phosphatase